MLMLCLYERSDVQSSRIFFRDFAVYLVFHLAFTYFGVDLMCTLIQIWLRKYEENRSSLWPEGTCCESRTSQAEHNVNFNRHPFNTVIFFSSVYVVVFLDYETVKRHTASLRAERNEVFLRFGEKYALREEYYRGLFCCILRRCFKTMY